MAPKYRYTLTGEIFTREEMEQYCRENFDWGDPTNYATYLTAFWQEYGFEEVFDNED